MYHRELTDIELASSDISRQVVKSALDHYQNNGNGAHQNEPILEPVTDEPIVFRYRLGLEEGVTLSVVSDKPDSETNVRNILRNKPEYLDMADFPVAQYTDGKLYLFSKDNKGLVGLDPRDFQIIGYNRRETLSEVVGLNDDYFRRVEEPSGDLLHHDQEMFDENDEEARQPDEINIDELVHLNMRSTPMRVI